METGGLGSLFWLIVIGALFYFMMRWGGCGGRMEHGERAGKHEGHGGGMAATGLKDPVCGMDVDPAKAKTSVYEDRTYY